MSILFTMFLIAFAGIMALYGLVLAIASGPLGWIALCLGLVFATIPTVGLLALAGLVFSLSPSQQVAE